MSLSIPEAIALSMGLTEEARTRTSTSLGAICGVGISCRVGPLSKLSSVMARIGSISSFLGCSLCMAAVVSDIRAIAYALYPEPFWFHS